MWTYITDAIPEIIAGLVVTAILAIIGRFYSLRHSPKKIKRNISQSIDGNNTKNINISPKILPQNQEQNELLTEEITLPDGTDIDEMRKMIVSNLRELQNLIAKTETQALNWRPVPNVNSTFVLATHITAQSEEWVCHYVGGMPIERNRNAEFTVEAKPPVWAQELTERIDEIIEKIEIVFERLEEGDLNKTIVLQGKAKGIGTILYCLVHVIEHSSSHLAEIRMIKDLSDFRKSMKD